MVAQPVSQPRAAIYCRVSTIGQEDNYSLASQEAACRRYAATKGYAVAEEHIHHEVHTGSELRERRKLGALREALRRREVDAVICYALDRLSRKQAHIAIVADECEQAGAALLFVTEEFEKSAVGEFIRSAKGFAAEIQREKNQEGAIRGMRARVESGKPFGGGRAPYGYRWRDEDRTGYDADPDTAPIVRRMFALAAGGTTLRQIAATLEAEGIPTPRGKALWSHASINAILGNEAYTGVVKVNRVESKRVGGKIVHRRRPDDELVTLPEGTCPPLIDRATFEAVQAQQARNKASARRKSIAPELFLLRGGLVVCGYCGRTVPTRYGADGTGRRYPLYVANQGTTHRDCGHTFSISAPLLDQAVWQRAEAILSDKRLIADQIARLRESDPTEADLATIDRTLAEVDRKRANLARRVAGIDDDEAAAPLVAEIAALGKQRKQLDHERGAVLAAREGWEAAQDRLDGLEEWYRTVAANLPRGTYDQKREALEIFGFRVKLYERDHNPRWEVTTAIDVDALWAGTPCPTSSGAAAR